MAVGDVYKATLKGALQGQQVWHAFHFIQRAADSVLVASQGSVLEHLEYTLLTDPSDFTPGGFVSTLLDIYPNDYVVSALELQKVVRPHTPGPAARVIGPGGSLGAAGTRFATGQLLPPWLACVVTWRSGFTGKRYRGRSYFAGMYETDINGNAIDISYREQVQAFVDFCAAHLFEGGSSNWTDTWKMGVYSKRSLSASVDVPSAVTTLESATVRSQLCTQRSRR